MKIELLLEVLLIFRNYEVLRSNSAHPPSGQGLNFSSLSNCTLNARSQPDYLKKRGNVRFPSSSLHDVVVVNSYRALLRLQVLGR
jgi:hypothetical protein